MNKFKNKLWLLLTILAFAACEEKNDPVNEEILMVNNWISDIMNEVYYWDYTISDDLTPDDKTTPETFFNKHLHPDDLWSWMTDDYEALQAEYAGVPVAMGFSPYFTRISDDEIVIFIEYVYENSPADRALLKRGDIIYEIDGEKLTIDNYSDLYNQTSYTASIAQLEDNTITPKGTVNLTAEVVDADPTIYSDIIEVNGKKIGYLVYAEFISGNSNEFLESLGTALKNLADRGMEELIVDLRYNLGGELTAAQFLASAIAPLSVVNNNDIIVELDYNDLYDNYFETNSPEEKYVLFENNDYCLNMDKVYFLTTWHSASASEFVIVGLEPYMDVVQVGGYTYGKYTGMWVIPDIEKPARHNFAIAPITCKYINTNGYTDFVDGLTPDIEVEDDGLFYGIPLGDVSDPIIAAAIEDITGTPVAGTRKMTGTQFTEERVLPVALDRKTNLLMNKNTLSSVK